MVPRAIEYSKQWIYCESSSVNILFHVLDRSTYVRFNVLRFFFGVFVKSHVYTGEIDAFKDNIEAFIRELLAEMLERV